MAQTTIHNVRAQPIDLDGGLPGQEEPNAGATDAAHCSALGLLSKRGDPPATDPDVLTYQEHGAVERWLPLHQEAALRADRCSSSTPAAKSRSGGVSSLL
jgi:hypothetical protein